MKDETRSADAGRVSFYGRLKSRQQLHEVRLRGLVGFAHTLRVTATTGTEIRSTHSLTPHASSPDCASTNHRNARPVARRTNLGGGVAKADFVPL